MTARKNVRPCIPIPRFLSLSLPLSFSNPGHWSPGRWPPVIALPRSSARPVEDNPRSIALPHVRCLCATYNVSTRISTRERPVGAIKHLCHCQRKIKAMPRSATPCLYDSFRDGVNHAAWPAASETGTPDDVRSSTSAVCRPSARNAVIA